jgi:hypothetical protein
MNNEPVAWTSQDVLDADHIIKAVVRREQDEQHTIPLYTHPEKTLTDEEWNKAFDCYCETDEGVLKFDLELRDEWKKEQLIRWKEALRKAQEK